MINLTTRRLKPVRQSEAYECTLACIVMIANYYGHSMTLSQLRVENPSMSRGGSLRDLIEISTRLGLGSRAVKLPMTSLKSINHPAILHWDFNHFVVLEKVTKQGVHIIDPAFGRRFMPFEEAKDHFTGVALELLPLPSFDPRAHSTPDRASKNSLVNFSMFLQPLAKLIAISIAVMAFSLIAPLAVQIIVDEVIVKNDVDLLLIIAGVFLATNLMASFAQYLQDFHILKYTSKTRIALTQQFLANLMRLPWSYFAKRNLGTFVAQYNSLNYIVTFFVKIVGGLIVDTLFIAVVLVILFLISPEIAALVLIANAFVVAIRFALYAKSRKLQDDEVVDKSGEEAYFVETMRGISSIKANALEFNRVTDNLNKTISAVNSSFGLKLFGLRYALFMQSTKSLEVIAVLFLLAELVMEGTLTIGVMYAFYSYRMFLDQRLTSLTDSIAELLNLKVHQDRLEETFGNEEVSKSKFDIGHFMKFRGDIEIEDISYRIDNNRKTVFDRFSGKLKQGQFVHVNGPTGVGKSTLLKIILNIVEPDSGRVLFDQVPVNDENMSILRNSVGVVLQEDTLFKGSILQNVALFDEFLDLERFEKVCKTALIWDEIISLPLGYQSEVGDMGANLSTGQQQRLLLARALYRNPTILILDEATANLNVDVERQILQNIKDLKKTVIFSSHSAEISDFADLTWDLKSKAEVEPSIEAVE